MNMTVKDNITNGRGMILVMVKIQCEQHNKKLEYKTNQRT